MCVRRRSPALQIAASLILSSFSINFNKIISENFMVLWIGCVFTTRDIRQATCIYLLERTLRWPIRHGFTPR